MIPNTAIKGWYIIGLQGHHDKEQLIIFKFLKENIRPFCKFSLITVDDSFTSSWTG